MESVAVPPRQVLAATHPITKISTDHFEGDWPIEEETRRGAAVNPVVAAQVNSPYTTSGCSTIVTHVPHYVPRLSTIDWMVGAVAIIKALLDPVDDIKRRHDVFVSSVQQTIDMNNYLPTSYDDMAGWRTVVGKLSQPAVG